MAQQNTLDELNKGQPNPKRWVHPEDKKASIVSNGPGQLLEPLQGKGKLISLSHVKPQWVVSILCPILY